MDMTADDVRELLRQALRKENLSQRAMAKLIGISGQYLNDVLLRSREPTGLILDYLELDRIVTYRRRETKGRSAARRA